MTQLIKRTFRKIARATANWPIIGRFVNIGAIAIRLPQFYQSYLHLNHQQTILEERQRLFESQQLPNLLQTMADINNRQITTDNAKDNLTKSVPIAVRTITRDIVGIKTQLNQLSAMVESASSDTSSNFARHFTDIEYLYQRVEFVRRELMFEMRYGASRATGNSEALRAKTEILNHDKFLAAKERFIKVNLGCGHVALDGYLNVDRRSLPSVDIVAEVDELPFEKETVDEIFSAHLLEHFPQEELRRKLLNYWLELLKPGGTFRAVIPDADGMINAYKSGEYNFDRLREVTYGGQDYDGDFHYNMLSVTSMSVLLEEAGYGEIVVLAQNRENSGCKEFEISAKRKIGGKTNEK